MASHMPEARDASNIGESVAGSDAQFAAGSDAQFASRSSLFCLFLRKEQKRKKRERQKRERKKRKRERRRTKREKEGEGEMCWRWQRMCGNEAVGWVAWMENEARVLSERTKLTRERRKAPESCVRQQFFCPAKEVARKRVRHFRKPFFSNQNPTNTSHLEGKEPVFNIYFSVQNRTPDVNGISPFFPAV